MSMSTVRIQFDFECTCPPPVVGVLSLVEELTLEKMVKALLPSFKACIFVQISLAFLTMLY